MLHKNVSDLFINLIEDHKNDDENILLQDHINKVYYNKNAYNARAKYNRIIGLFAEQ